MVWGCACQLHYGAPRDPGGIRTRTSPISGTPGRIRTCDYRFRRPTPFQTWPRALKFLEWVIGFEPTTSTLARSRSTTELHPRGTPGGN